MSVYQNYYFPLTFEKGEKFSSFYHNGLFGAYPNQAEVYHIESKGVTHFINLTTEEEKMEEYKVSKNRFKINFPIGDNRYPSNVPEFCKLIYRIFNIITEGSKVYIHCRAGHGRSAMVVACLLCLLHNITPSTAIYWTTVYHHRRPSLREKWLSLIMPPSKRQQSFIHRLFQEIFFLKAYRLGPFIGFSNLSSHYVSTKLGTFQNSELALRAELEREINPSGLIKIKAMTEIIRLKYLQHPEIVFNLINTGFQKIIKNDRYDSFWGIGRNGDGNNEYGLILEKVREEIFEEKLLNEITPSIIEYINFKEGEIEVIETGRISGCGSYISFRSLSDLKICVGDTFKKGKLKIKVKNLETDNDRYGDICFQHPCCETFFFNHISSVSIEEDKIMEGDILIKDN